MPRLILACHPAARSFELALNSSALNATRDGPEIFEFMAYFNLSMDPTKTTMEQIKTVYKYELLHCAGTFAAVGSLVVWLTEPNICTSSEMLLHTLQPLQLRPASRGRC
jgi:hypothetical protein